MTKDEFEDAKALWKLVYANHCFKHVKGVCSYILDQKIDCDHPIYYALIVSIYVLYGKPFKRSNVVGKLSEAIVPVKHRDLHQHLLRCRDQLYVHADAKGFQLPDLGEVNQVRFLALLNERAHKIEVSTFSTEFKTRLPLLPDVMDLCQTLDEKTEYHIGKLQKRHVKKLPRSAGEYAINILDENGPFVTKEKPLLRNGLRSSEAR